MAYQIVPFQEAFHAQLVSVWEKSVLATHEFLDLKDFGEIRQLVYSLDFTSLPVFCLTDRKEVIGFIGVHSGKVEMLFLHPDYFGRGLGKKLMDYAISEHKAYLVDVNEQNTSAVAFYRKLGFQAYERSELDEQGRKYPILKMRLDSV